MCDRVMGRACEETQSASKGGRKCRCRGRIEMNDWLNSFLGRNLKRKRQRECWDQEAADIRSWESRARKLCLSASAIGMIPSHACLGTGFLLHFQATLPACIFVA